MVRSSASRTIRRALGEIRPAFESPAQTPQELASFHHESNAKKATRGWPFSHFYSRVEV